MTSMQAWFVRQPRAGWRPPPRRVPDHPAWRPCGLPTPGAALRTPGPSRRSRPPADYFLHVVTITRDGARARILRHQHVVGARAEEVRYRPQRHACVVTTARPSRSVRDAGRRHRDNSPLEFPTHHAPVRAHAPSTPQLGGCSHPSQGWWRKIRSRGWVQDSSPTQPCTDGDRREAILPSRTRCPVTASNLPGGLRRLRRLLDQLLDLCRSAARPWRSTHARAPRSQLSGTFQPAATGLKNPAAAAVTRVAPVGHDDDGRTAPPLAPLRDRRILTVSIFSEVVGPAAHATALERGIVAEPGGKQSPGGSSAAALSACPCRRPGNPPPPMPSRRPASAASGPLMPPPDSLDIIFSPSC